MKTKLLIMALMVMLIGAGEAFAQCVSGDCQSGRGVFKEQNGSVYEGPFVNGKFEGQGEYRNTDGSKYVGEFKAGMFAARAHTICQWRQVCRGFY
jgi:hypothetical protein